LALAIRITNLGVLVINTFVLNLTSQQVMAICRDRRFACSAVAGASDRFASYLDA
jgi:hypothetical protein